MPFARVAAIFIAVVGLLGEGIFGQAAAASDQTVSREDLIALHMHFVDEAGFAVTDIQPDDVEVFATGEPQRVVRVIGPMEPFHVGLLLDVSPSTEENIDSIRNETARFFRSLRDEDDALILTFDDEVYVDCDWTTDRKKVDEAIWEFGLQKPGSTSVIHDAIVMTLEQKYVERGPRHAMVLFTDGFEVGSDMSEKEALQALRRWGILTYVIQYDSRPYHRRLFGSSRPYDPRYPGGTGPTAGTKVGGVVIGGMGGGRADERSREEQLQYRYKKASTYLWNVAQSGRGKRLNMINGSDLGRIYDSILNDLHMIYTVMIVPTKEASAHMQPITVRTKREGVFVKLVTEGYWAK